MIHSQIIHHHIVQNSLSYYWFRNCFIYTNSLFESRIILSLEFSQKSRRKKYFYYFPNFALKFMELTFRRHSVRSPIFSKKDLYIFEELGLCRLNMHTISNGSLVVVRCFDCRISPGHPHDNL